MTAHAWSHAQMHSYCENRSVRPQKLQFSMIQLIEENIKSRVTFEVKAILSRCMGTKHV